MSTLAYAYESGYQDGLKAAGTEKQEYERRIDELCQENEQLRQRNAKLRELADSSYTFAFNCYHGVFDQEAFFRLREKYRDSGNEVDG